MLVAAAGGNMQLLGLGTSQDALIRTRIRAARTRTSRIGLPSWGLFTQDYPKTINHSQTIWKVCYQILYMCIHCIDIFMS
jgi:hypothetical protein